MHQGPMVTTEAQKAVVRVNQSKVRKDHDEWHDVPIPNQLKTEGELKMKAEKIVFEPTVVKKEEPQEAAHVACFGDATSRPAFEAAHVADMDDLDVQAAYVAWQNECVWTIQSSGKN